MQRNDKEIHEFELIDILIQLEKLRDHVEKIIKRVDPDFGEGGG